MSYILLIIGILIFSTGMLYMFITPMKSIMLMLFLLFTDFSMSSYFPALNNVIKIVIIICWFVLFTKKKVEIDHTISKILKIITLLEGITIVLLFKYKLPNYEFMDSFRTIISIYTGIILMSIKWSNTIRGNGFKMLSWLGVINFAIHILCNGITGFSRLSGLISAPSLVMVNAISMVSAYVIASVYKRDKYYYLVALNYFLCGLCVMRGGLIFGSIVLLSIIWPHINKIKMKSIIQGFVFAPAVFIGLRIIAGKIIAKTYNFTYNVSDVKINTSNRIWCWQEILKATGAHRILGWGLGYSKKITGIWVAYGYQAMHNEYLRWLVETGIVGVISIILCFWMLYKGLSKKQIGIDNRILKGLFIGFAIFSFTDNTLYSVIIWLSFCTLISLLYKRDVV